MQGGGFAHGEGFSVVDAWSGFALRRIDGEFALRRMHGKGLRYGERMVRVCASAHSW